VASFSSRVVRFDPDTVGSEHLRSCMLDLVVRTNAFNTSRVEPHFINPTCFGEDFARWLAARLSAVGLEVAGPGQKDWGWYLDLVHEGRTHIVGISFASPAAAEKSGTEETSEWHVTIDAPRLLSEVLTMRKNRTAPPSVVDAVRHALQSRPDIAFVHDDQA
jgi:hypothetical protein